MRGLLIALMLVAGEARAESVEEKIRAYKESIESTQREIASVLVLQNFAYFFVETLDQTDVAKQLAYYTSSGGKFNVDKATKALIEAIYSNKLDQEKIDKIGEMLILMRRAKVQWINMGADLQSSYKSFVSNFSEDLDICAEDRFAKALAVLQHYSPQGVNTQELARSWQLSLGGTITVNDEGPNTFGYYGSLAFETDSDSAEARHAAATTGAALATYLPPPYNAVGVVAIPIAIEVIWGAVEMRDHMRELEAIAQANEDLYEATRFEVNIRAYFNTYCAALKRSYLEARPLVLNVETPDGRRALEQELARLSDLLGEEDEEFLLENSAISKEPEQFYLFFKRRLLAEALLLDDYSRRYYDAWNVRMTRIDGFVDKLESALIQVVKAKVEAEFKPDERVMELIARVENLTAFKTNFYDLVLEFYAATPDGRSRILSEATALADSYETRNPYLAGEELTFLDAARAAIAQMEKDGD